MVSLSIEVVSSLAGRVSSPRLPEGETRIGGFGGVDGLIEYLESKRISAIVDATHPFAQRMTRTPRPLVGRPEYLCSS